MITEIDIWNFKSIRHLTLFPVSLNLLMGLNGMGKSSFIQSLLLLRQNRKNLAQKLKLNGNLVDIGRGKDALYYFADTNEEITFELAFKKDGDKESLLNLDYAYDSESDVLRSTRTSSDTRIPDEPLFGSDFIFLSAERITPAVTYDMSHDAITAQNSLGNHGELAIHFLEQYGTTIKVSENLCLPGAPSNHLEDQVAAWMDVISPGVKINTDALGDIDKVKLTYQFKTASNVTNEFRPTNVGFGITYILPVLVACLCGKYKLLIIENPEAHLHPKGQSKLGELLARCAAEGAQLFVETHSDHIVNGVRVAVKNKILPPYEPYIQYFTKKYEADQTYTAVTPIKIGSNGELSEYPADFMDEWEIQLMKLI